MTPSLSAEILKDLPPVNGAQIEEGLSREIRSSAVKFVVLDDDPTGVQTVHDVSVYTDWSIESLKQGLLEPQKLFYVLTNSRGMTAAESEEAHRQIARGPTPWKRKCCARSWKPPEDRSTERSYAFSSKRAAASPSATSTPSPRTAST